MTRLFSDGFESNNFNAWSYEGGTYAVVSSPVHTGTYAARATGSGSYWAIVLGLTYADLYARAYVRFPALVASGKSEKILTIWDSTYTQEVAVFIYNSGAQYYWVMTTPSGVYTSAATIATNTWYCVEIRRLVGDATHGHGTLWVDGNQLLDRTETITGNSQPVQGGLLYTDDTSGLISYGDDYVVADARIGCYVNEFLGVANASIGAVSFGGTDILEANIKDIIYG